jgi:signal peptidase II
MASKNSNSALLPWLGIALIVIVLDQLTKVWVLQHFHYGDSRTVTSFFNLVRHHNTGAAFSFLANASGWQRWFFVGLGAAATTFIVWLLRRHGSQTLFAGSLTLILGGAIGNVIDRIWHGYVVDFLQFHWHVLEALFHQGAFPSFNVADSAITLGALGLIWDELRRVGKS